MMSFLTHPNDGPSLLSHFGQVPQRRYLKPFKGLQEKERNPNLFDKNYYPKAVRLDFDQK